jgi:hypothetical protein
MKLMENHNILVQYNRPLDRTRYVLNEVFRGFLQSSEASTKILSWNMSSYCLQVTSCYILYDTQSIPFWKLRNKSALWGMRFLPRWSFISWSSVLWCRVMIKVSTFRRTMLPPSSASKWRQKMNCSYSWAQRQQGPPKRWCPLNELFIFA